MTKAKDTKKEVKKTTKPVEKVVLVPRIHFNEFLMNHQGLNDMEKAGFKAFAGETVWKRPNEWEECFKQYNNRNK